MSVTYLTPYASVTQSIRELEGIKLHEHEAEAIRVAADARIFGDDDVTLQTAHADVILSLLEESGRLAPAAAGRLRAQLFAITPHRVALAA